MRILKNILIAVLIAMPTVSALGLPAFAANRLTAVPTIPAERQAERLADGAGLLSESEAAVLLKKLDEISERQACDVIIVTTDSLQGKTATAYADDTFDYTGYGYGENDDGILLLISMEDRDWAISTHGYGIEAFTDAGQAYIMDRVLPRLRVDDFYAGFSRFADTADELLTQARSGSPYDVVDETGRTAASGTDANDRIERIIASTLTAVFLSLIPVSIMKSKHKSIRPKDRADDYIRSGSFRLTGQSDRFLYRNVSRIRRQTQSSSGGGRGGSRTHISSSGRSHGGSRGKF